MEKDDKYWESVAEKVNEELSELYAARDDHTAELELLNERIFERERVLTSLQPLTTKADEALKPSIPKVDGIRERMPLAEAIRTVLQAIQTFQTARAIRDILEASGYDVSGHSNFLASVHGVLKRFLESGEAVKLDSHGKTFYRIARLKMSRASRTADSNTTEVGLGVLRRRTAPETAVERAVRESQTRNEPTTAVEKAIENAKNQVLKRR